MGQYDIVYGAKYEQTKNMSNKEVAKIIRTEIRTYMKQFGKKYKVSVKLHHYNSINVTVTPNEEINPFSKGYTNAIINDETRDYLYTNSLNQRYNLELSKILDDLDDIKEAYNYDGSDIQTDYFNVRFYGSVQFEDWGIYDKIKNNPETYFVTDEEIEEELEALRIKNNKIYTVKEEAVIITEEVKEETNIAKRIKKLEINESTIVVKSIYSASEFVRFQNIEMIEESTHNSNRWSMLEMN
jgi:hypothetical protein